MQPLIAPLYERRTTIEVLAAFIDAQNGKSSHDLVKDYWTRAHGGKIAGWTIADSNGQPFRPSTLSGSTRCMTGLSRYRFGIRDAEADPLVGVAAAQAPPNQPRPGSQPRWHRAAAWNHLPARSDYLGRPLREQRLAAGTAEAADEDHVGPRGVGQPASWPNEQKLADGDVIELRLSAARRRGSRSRSFRAIPTTR